MSRAAAALPILFTLAACGGGGVTQGERQRALTAARAGMDSVRALPGGKQATFRAVRLMPDGTVCGTIDGNDGFGARAFATKDGTVALADPRDAATGAAITTRCDGPARAITSRNEQFSDIDVAQ